MSQAMTTADGKEVLKACPFCGKEPHLLFSSASNEQTGYNFSAFVRCDKCRLELQTPTDFNAGGWCTESRESVGKRAVAAWNQRAPSAQALDPGLWQVVPKEPTIPMCNISAAISAHTAMLIWNRMLAAAPSPPAPDAAAKDLYALGISVMKDGERVDPRELYAPPDIAQVREGFEAFMRTQGESQFARYNDGEYVRPIDFEWAIWCAALGVKP